MDLIILLGASLLGAVFVLSGSGGRSVPSLWKATLGIAGGTATYFILRYFEVLPGDPSISLLMILFVTGGFAGGLSLLAFVYVRPFFRR